MQTTLSLLPRRKRPQKKIAELIKGFLKERGLELSTEKTQITHIDDGFDFLGWNFRKYKGKLLIKPSKKAIDNVTRKVSGVIKRAKAWNQANLIDARNPIIIGWSNYHQSVVSAEILRNLDHRMWNMLWRWAKRRHPDKSRTWVHSFTQNSFILTAALFLWQKL